MFRQTIFYTIFFLLIISFFIPLQAKGEKMWDSGRISLSGHSLATQGSLKDELPYGYGYTFVYDQGLDKLMGKRYAFMPGFRIEWNFIDFKKTKKR